MKALLPLALLLACSPSDLDPMEAQPKYRAYTENAFFEDTRAMRVPPEGTVPREAKVERRQPGGAGDGDALPLPITRELLARGQQRYQILCATCHGLLGDGKSLVAANMALRPPPSLIEEGHDHGDGKVFDVITRGYGLMPAYRDEIPDQDDRWAVVAYLRALRLARRAPLEEAPPDERRKLEAR